MTREHLRRLNIRNQRAPAEAGVLTLEVPEYYKNVNKLNANYQWLKWEQESNKETKVTVNEK